jgi:AbiV family abortive infection protein
MRLTCSRKRTSCGATSAARAYFLAHIACEELGKLPILTTAAVAQRLGHDVDWRRIDRVLRSHRSKIKQILFIDSVVGGQGVAEGKAAYEADLKRMRLYIDMKNASLYSFAVEGRFGRPLKAIPCEIYDAFRALAEGRCHTSEWMYLAPMGRAGGLPAFSDGLDSPRFKTMMAALTGEACREQSSCTRLRRMNRRSAASSSASSRRGDDSGSRGGSSTGQATTLAAPRAT